jgi:hypothetical protein
MVGRDWGQVAALRPVIARLAQCVPRLWLPLIFAQARALQPEVCKTVGSAYVGSNPTPATSFRRSKPVTQVCVTGSYVQRERLLRPFVLLVGYAWARSGRPQSPYTAGPDAL